MGGMAVVYKTEDAILGRCVALKILHRRYAEEASFRSRFKQEARVMASLDHENIVKVYDISQDGEVPFIVAEYVDGRDVGDMLKGAPDGRLSEQFTRRIAAQLLRALAYAHRRRVIHRDIKPSNVLITHEGTAKVADFGIARIVEDQEVGKPGEIIGSARYMSPEQLKGEETTPRSDLYSVGILLYHCLTGRPPFSGDTSSVARQQIHKDPTPPRELNKAISPRLEAVILKALAKDPEERYPSALAMLESLRNNANVKGSDKAARKPSKGRKALLAFSMLALLFLGGGTAAAGLGYVDLQDLPLSQRAEETALAPAQPAEEEPPPPVVVPEEEAPQEIEQNTAPEEDLEAAPPLLVPVPNVDAYLDYSAEEILASSGFQTEVVRDYREGYAPSGVTWGTDPVVGTLMPVGSTITIYATPRDQPPVPQPPVTQPQVQQIQPQPPVLQPQPPASQPPGPQPPVPQPQIPG
jgi:serine/threonine protein kinase